MTKSPSNNNNGLLRCYNMFPTHFENIQAMTAYLPKLQEMGFNAVWLNPIQLTGQSPMVSGDPITSHSQKVKGSLYAMADCDLIDPRFSVVKRDEDGDMLLLASQREQLLELVPIDPVDNALIKESRAVILALKDQIRKRETELNRLKKALDKLHLDGADVTNTEITISSISKKKGALERSLVEEEATYHAYLANHHQCLFALDRVALQNFTKTAKSLGLTPMFDLVFNHVAIDSPYVEMHPEFFNPDDRTFPDTMAFSYSKLLGSRHSAPISESEAARILRQIPDIIDTFWRPFVTRYIEDYGFSGVRVDCVRKVPHQVRRPVYQMIRALVEAQDATVEPIILEETLFSDLSPKDYVALTQDAGATHNTGSVYYQEREWHGGLSPEYNNEDYYKHQTAQNGVINFTGNHDHDSCAMTVCRKLAFERLESNPELYQAYLAEIKSKEEKAMARGQSLADGTAELIKSFFIHYYIQEIIFELKNPDTFNETVLRFGKAYRDKLLTSALSGSGGYYLLSGDEVGKLSPSSVFLRDNSEDIRAQKLLRIFRSDYNPIAQEVLEAMAQATLLRRSYKDMYLQASAFNQKAMRSSLIEQYFNEINAGVSNTLETFKKMVRARMKTLSSTLDEALFEPMEAPMNASNRWHAPSSLDAFTSTDFFAEMNAIIERLPRSHQAFWSELFKAVSDDLLISVRVNGTGYDGDIDIIIFNLNPHRSIQFDIEDMHKIAMWFQKRGFPESNPEALRNPDYEKAYQCVMGQTKPAKLYFGGQLELSSELTSNAGFAIQVLPKQTTPEALFAPLPKAIVYETRVPDSLRDLVTQQLGEFNMAGSSTMSASSGAGAKGKLKA